MRATNERLTILSEIVQAALYEIPDFDDAQRLNYLNLAPEAEEEVNVTLSVTEAFQTLHSTISAAGLKLDACSNNTKALRKILEDLPRFIRRNDIERVC
jgi:hypothetical protein